MADRRLAEEIQRSVVGRRRQAEVVAAALAAQRHVLLEGPPGTGKSSLLRALAQAAGLGFVLVEGNAELTPARLLGHHDPSRIMAEGYAQETFVDGPLATALRDGSLLYLEEINRIPEETLNLLITVMSEGELHVPRLGRLVAAPGFALVAAMNPFDTIGTARISSAIYDRTCRVLMDYQDAEEEAEIVARAVQGVGAGTGDGARSTVWRSRVVDLVRRTRGHPDVRVGSSVRGAIDLVLLADRLAGLRGQAPDHPEVSLDATLAALSGRIRLHEGSGRLPEDVLTELWGQTLGPEVKGAGGWTPGEADPAVATGEPGPMGRPPPQGEGGPGKPWAPTVTGPGRDGA